jgi:hypothetical protein
MLLLLCCCPLQASSSSQLEQEEQQQQQQQQDGMQDRNQQQQQLISRDSQQQQQLPQQSSSTVPPPPPPPQQQQQQQQQPPVPPQPPQQQRESSILKSGAISAITAAAAAAVAAASAAAAADSQPAVPNHLNQQDTLNTLTDPNRQLSSEEVAKLQQQLAILQREAAKVPALHATAKAATEHALHLERQLQDSMQHNAVLQQQLMELRAAQQREREQAAVLAGNGSAMAQQLAEAQREAEGLRQVQILC